jgi:hypothetical protein
MDALRVAFCLYGPIDRASPVTWPTLRQHVLDPMRAVGMLVTIFTFDLRSAPALIDGVPPCHNEGFVPCDVCTHRAQSTLTFDDVPAKLRSTFFSSYSRKSWINTQRERHAGGGTDGGSAPAHDSRLNALRQLYSERTVGEWLAQHAADFDVAVACSPDLFVPIPIDLADVLTAAGRGPHLSNNTLSNSPIVFTPAVSDRGSHTPCPVSPAYIQCLTAWRCAALRVYALRR